VKFQPEGGVGLGAPATHRARELVYAREVPMRRLLEFDGGVGASRKSYDAFYGQSWLLFHYLMFEPERAGQLQQYQSLLAAGKPPLEAATSAFGDLDKLERELERYQERRRLNYLLIDAKALAIGPISVRRLRPGEAAMMPTRIESRVGVTREEALELLPEARRVAELHPDDAAVLAALAEAEYDAGNDDDAIAAADRALAINPDEIEAHIQKGFALHRKAKAAGNSKELWQEARNQFIRANKVENDNPIPLYWYYLTFREGGETPTRNAVEGLEWAMTLAPFDPGLRWRVAQQMISDERLEDAARTLGPLAYSPHPGEHTERALKLLKEVEARIAGELGTPED
jgi:tetratricopeptide (TPR) repeat protein